LSEIVHDLRQAKALILDRAGQRPDVGRPLRRDHSMLGKMPAQRVDQLGTLAHKHLPGAEQHGMGLLLFGLHRHKAHHWPRSGIGYGLGIGCVVLLWLPPLAQEAFEPDGRVIECVLLSGFQCGRSRSRWPVS
jgi:hypothetical protein